MLVNFSAFAERVRDPLYFGSLPDWQATPLRELITRGRDLKRSRQDVAYVLATAHHETGRFRSMEEWGAGSSQVYGEPIHLWRNRTVSYHGRGFVQLTWLGNYARMSMLTGIDLVSNPDMAKDPVVAAMIIWEGMIGGVFTGVSLADCRTHTGLDFHAARRIVNGLDRADLIADYAKTFDAALADAEVTA